MEGLTLGQAITAVETASGELGTADANQAAAQQRYDSALTAKASADDADSAAVAKFNESLDTLISAATAAKVSR